MNSILNLKPQPKIYRHSASRRRLKEAGGGAARVRTHRVELKDPGSAFDGGGGSLTLEGRSQHLSLLVQAKLQTISNIWSWNCGGKDRKKKKQNMKMVLWYMCL